jgi:hypothetical protein
MTARIRASWRIVFALTLLLAAPAGVGAEASGPAVTVVAPLVLMRANDLGSAPHTVTVSRIIFTPGASEEAEALPGPRLVVVESGTLAFHAIGEVTVVRAPIEPDSGPTTTPTPEPTPTPARSPTTDVTLNRGDAAPVPIWTMHAFRNDGTTPAVILDIRITSGGAPGLPADLDAEVLAEETGLTTLPTSRAAIALGHGTVAVGGMVLAAPTGAFQMVAAVDGDGQIEPAGDGSLRNVGAEPRDVYVVAIAPIGAAGPRQPEQPATGPGGAAVAFDSIVTAHYGLEEQGYWIWEPAEQEGVAAAGPFPVVLYLAGCCTGDAAHYTSSPDEVKEWIEHLTRRGTIVIAPRLRADEAQDDLMAAMRSADWTRLAVFGFSFGGWFGPIYAGAAAEGLPVPRAIFSTVAYDPGTTPDLSAIPASTHVIVLVTDGYEDPGGRRVWAALTTVPDEHRDFVMLVTDRHGTPVLNAVHEAPATAMWGTLNALDWYGTWKLGDALMSCAFAEQDCEYAHGNTPEQRFMGYWSDGVPVAELVVIDDPGPPDAATPTT